MFSSSAGNHLSIPISKVKNWDKTILLKVSFSGNLSDTFINMNKIYTNQVKKQTCRSLISMIWKETKQ